MLRISGYTVADEIMRIPILTKKKHSDQEEKTSLYWTIRAAQPLHITFNRCPSPELRVELGRHILLVLLEHGRQPYACCALPPHRHLWIPGIHAEALRTLWV